MHEEFKRTLFKKYGIRRKQLTSRIRHRMLRRLDKEACLDLHRSTEVKIRKGSEVGIGLKLGW